MHRSSHGRRTGDGSPSVCHAGRAKLLPAGEYTVRTLDDGGSSIVSALVGANGVHAAVPAKRVPQTGPGSADLKFVRSPSGLKLSHIFVADQSYFYELMP